MGGDAVCGSKYGPGDIGRNGRALLDRMPQKHDRRVGHEASPAVGATGNPAERRPLRICFLVDARSPIACNWIKYFTERGSDVHVISSYPCLPGTLEGATIYEAPVLLSGFSRASQVGGKSNSSRASMLSRLKGS